MIRLLPQCYVHSTNLSTRQHAYKARVGHLNDGPNCEKRVAHLTGVQLTLPGIPCIYYGTVAHINIALPCADSFVGTEQAFTGHGDGDKYTLSNKHLVSLSYARL